MLIIRHKITFLLIFSTFSLYGRDTLITVSPYASSYVSIPCELKLDTVNWNFWYEDTITFSTGLKITFMDLDQFIVKNYMGIGGLVFIDTVSSVAYKFNQSIIRRNDWSGRDSSWIQPGMYTCSIGNPDIIWNDATSFPDSFALCDSFVYADSGISGTKIFLRAKCLYSITQYLNDMGPHTNRLENFNAIYYVKKLNNYHMKLQVSNVIIKEYQDGPNNEWYSYPTSINLFWAADSCGNGIFKHGQVSNHNVIKESKLQKDKVLLSILNGVPYLNAPSILNTDEEYKVTIYNLKGKTILQKQTKCLKRINLHHLYPGAYLVNITQGEIELNWNFSIVY